MITPAALRGPEVIDGLRSMAARLREGASPLPDIVDDASTVIGQTNHLTTFWGVADFHQIPQLQENLDRLLTAGRAHAWTSRVAADSPLHPKLAQLDAAVGVLAAQRANLSAPLAELTQLSEAATVATARRNAAEQAIPNFEEITRRYNEGGSADELLDAYPDGVIDAHRTALAELSAWRMPAADGVDLKNSLLALRSAATDARAAASSLKAATDEHVVQYTAVADHLASASSSA